MRLADFIDAYVSEIVDVAEVFAASQVPDGIDLDSEALRDHIPEILAAVATDLRTSQTSDEALAKSECRNTDVDSPKTAAQIHGRLRAKSGFEMVQMVAEYRALRASVLRLWIAHEAPDSFAFEDMLRFNEAIDQAVAESVVDFSIETDSWRQVFLGVLGHELRGPLNAILLTSQVMAKMGSDSPFSAQADRLIRSGQRMTELLDKLLDYNRTALGMGMRIIRTEGDLVRPLEEEIEVLSAALPGATIHFTTKGITDGAFDISRVRETLSNLVTNAVKHGASDTPILVTLHGNVEEVELTVENKGLPIASHLLQSIFEPLARGSLRPAEGEHTHLGLGLFIVREIAKAHGGSVTATSSEHGTAITVRLPRQRLNSNSTS